MINKTIKWFCTQMKLVYSVLSKNNFILTENWCNYTVSHLFQIILWRTGDLGGLLTNERITVAEKIDKLAEISLCCMMLADKLRDKKE